MFDFLKKKKKVSTKTKNGSKDVSKAVVKTEIKKTEEVKVISNAIDPKNEKNSKTKWPSLLDLSYFFAILTLILSALFVFPGTSLTMEFSKTFILTLGVLLSFVAYLLDVLYRGEVYIFKSPVLWGFGTFSIAYIISNIFSSSLRGSFFGYGFELNTTLSILALSLLFYLVVIFSRSAKRLKILSYSILGSFFVVSLLQILKYLMLSVSSLNPMAKIISETFPVFGGMDVSNVFGSSYDFAVLSSAVLFYSMIFSESVFVKGIKKFWYSLLLIISLINIFIFGFSGLWILDASIALVYFVSLFSFRKDEDSVYIRKHSWRALAFIAIAGLFILEGTGLRFDLMQSMGIKEVNVSLPTTSQTIEAGTSYMGGVNKLFGTGPNMFSVAWNKSRPATENIKDTWGNTFNYGGSLFATSLVSTGLIGLLAWILLIGMYIGFYIKRLKSRLTLSDHNATLSIAGLISSSVIFISLFIYVPSVISVIVYMMAFLSLTALVLVKSGSVSIVNFSFNKRPIVSFATVIIILVLLASIGYSGYVKVKQVYAFSDYRKAISLDSSDDNKLKLLNSSSQLFNSDLYDTALSDAYIVKMQSLIPAINSNPDDSISRKTFDAYFNASTELLGDAVLYNKSNYQNYLSLGRLYSLLVPSSPTAYDKAVIAYNTATELYPTYPVTYLLRAQLESAKGDVSKAREYVVKAFDVKPNYIEAYFVLSQIEVGQGNIASAIKILEQASVLSPRDAGILFNLGQLYYSDTYYTKASQAFENVVSLVPNYANAKYYLALSYQKLGRLTDALKIANGLLKDNPNNSTVKNLISQIRAEMTAPTE